MDEIGNLLNKDVIAECEKQFGKPYQAFSTSESLLMLQLFAMQSNKKVDVLRSSADTFFGMRWENFKTLLYENGFILCLKWDINHENQTDEGVIYYRKDGLILFADSYNGKQTINEGTVYGELEINMKGFSSFGFLSGGFYATNKFEFSFDLREGMLYKISKLKSEGRLLAEWGDKKKFLWFLDYTDTKNEGYDYKAITERRIKLLPVEVRYIMGK